MTIICTYPSISAILCSFQFLPPKYSSPFPHSCSLLAQFHQAHILLINNARRICEGQKGHISRYFLSKVARFSFLESTSPKPGHFYMEPFPTADHISPVTNFFEHPQTLQIYLVFPGFPAKVISPRLFPPSAQTTYPKTLGISSQSIKYKRFCLH